MVNIIIIWFPCWPAYQQGHPDNNSTIRNWQHLSLAVVVVATSNWFSITERQDICHNTQQRWMDRLIVIICTNSYNMIMHLNASLPFPVCACPWLRCHGGDTLNRREDQTKYTSFPALPAILVPCKCDGWVEIQFKMIKRYGNHDYGQGQESSLDGMSSNDTDWMTMESE